MAGKPETVAGSVAAKEAGLALAQIYNYIRKGAVKNYKADGWPTGKGIEVVMTEVLAAKESIARKPRAAKASSNGTGRVSRKARHDDEVAMHEALDEEEQTRRARVRNSGDEGNVVRLRRLDRTVKYPPCPVNPAHGELAPAKDEKTKGVRLQCWHQEHDGRMRNHPAGFAPATQFVFTEEEAQLPQPVGRLGVIMLEWIVAGRTDMSESLEAWMIKNDIQVWIPLR